MAEKEWHSPFYGQLEPRMIVKAAVDNSALAENTQQPMLTEIIAEFEGINPDALCREEVLRAPDSDGNPRDGYVIHKHAEIVTGISATGDRVPFLFRWEWSAN